MWSCDLYIQPVLLVTKVPTGLSAGKVAGGDVHFFFFFLSGCIESWCSCDCEGLNVIEFSSSRRATIIF